MLQKQTIRYALLAWFEQKLTATPLYVMQHGVDKQRDKHVCAVYLVHGVKEPLGVWSKALCKLSYPLHHLCLSHLIICSA